MPVLPQAPAVTVILPCYNLEHHIVAAIRSVQMQTFADFEVLVIDDGSTDTTAQAARATIDKDTRFRLIRTPHRGLSAARNAGLDVARGALIAFLDGDDTYLPGFLSTHVAELTRSGADWTASALQLVWADGTRINHSALHGAPQPEEPARWIALNDAREIARIFPSAWNKLYRRDLIGATRFIDGALFEDHPFFWTLACKAGRIRYLPTPLYAYTRGRLGQITDLADRAMFQQLDRLRDVAAIARAAPLSNIPEGLSQLATRVIHERLSTPAPDKLKARFLTDAGQLMADEKLQWDRAGALDIAPNPAPRLDPEMRLHVLVLAPDGIAPAATLRALHAQDMPLEQVQCINGAGSSMVAALLDHLSRVSVPWLACLRAGDLPAPDWASRCVEAGRRQNADGVIVAAQHDARVHDTGFALPETGLATPHPAMLMLHQRALTHLPKSLVNLPDPVAAICLVAHLRNKMQHVPAMLLRLAPHPYPGLGTLARTLSALPDELCPLTQTERASAFAHLAQMRMGQGRGRTQRFAIALSAGLARRSARLPPPITTEHIGTYLRLCLGGSRDENSATRSRK